MIIPQLRRVDGVIIRKGAITLLAVGLCLASSARAQEAGSPKASDETARPVVIFATLRLKPDKINGFLDVMRQNVVGSRHETDNNISFNVYQRQEGGNDLFLIERWRSKAALERHQTRDYLKAVMENLEADKRASYTVVKLTALSPPAPLKPIASPTTTCNIIVSLPIKPQDRETVLNAALDVVLSSRKMPGNVAFDLYHDTRDTNAFVIVERWTSTEAYEAFLSQPSYVTFHTLLMQSITNPTGDERRLLKDVSEP